MTFGPGRGQGVVVNHHFLHLELDATLRAPADWTIVNQPERLIFLAPDEAAEVVVTMQRVEGDASPRELLARRVEGADLGDGRSLDAGVFAGFTVVTVERLDIGPRRVRHALVRKDGQAWYFTATVRERGTFEAFDETFLQIIGSLDRLSEEQRQLAQPLQIETYMPEPGDTYEALAEPIAGRIDDPVAQLRLLNGDWPDGQPQPGRLIKILR